MRGTAVSILVALTVAAVWLLGSTGDRPDAHIDLALTPTDRSTRKYAVRSHDLPTAADAVLPWSVARPATGAADGSFLVEVARPGRYDLVATGRGGGSGGRVLAPTPAMITLRDAAGEQAFTLRLRENRLPWPAQVLGRSRGGIGSSPPSCGTVA